MSRLTRLIAVVCLAGNLTGCCGGVYTHWQNYVGWNDRKHDAYPQGIPNPKTTPPGPTSPVLPPPGSNTY